MRRLLTVLVLLIALLLSACAPKPRESIRIGLLPDINSTPFLIASEEGLYEETGVDVEIINFTSARERDSAIQAGEIDLANSDMLNVAFLQDSGFDVKAISDTFGIFVLVASPDNGEVTPSEIEGFTIGLSENTIIEYVVDRIIENHGIDERRINKEFIAQMPLRREMLLQSKIDAAGLPEPLASLSIAEGAYLITDSNQEGVNPGVILARGETIENNHEGIVAIYKAYIKAIEIINEDVSPFHDVLIEKMGFPDSLIDSYDFPVYNKPAIPGEDVVYDALDWLYKKDLLDTELTFADLVDDRFMEELN